MRLACHVLHNESYLLKGKDCPSTFTPYQVLAQEGSTTSLGLELTADLTWANQINKTMRIADWQLTFPKQTNKQTKKCAHNETKTKKKKKKTQKAVLSPSFTLLDGNKGCVSNRYVQYMLFAHVAML